MADEDDDNGGLVLAGLLLLGLLALVFSGGGEGKDTSGDLHVHVIGSDCLVGGEVVDCATIPERAAGRRVVVYAEQGSQGVVMDLRERLTAAGVEHTVED